MLHWICSFVGGVQEQVPAGCSNIPLVWWVVCRKRYLQGAPIQLLVRTREALQAHLPAGQASSVILQDYQTSHTKLVSLLLTHVSLFL